MATDNSIITFEDVSFFYIQKDAPEKIEDITEEDIQFIFRNLDLKLPAGVLSVIGENGIGKSTLMLLAAGRLHPVSGKISIFDTDTGKFRNAVSDPALENERNGLASVVYQNMEFESDDTLETILTNVFSGGLHESKDQWVLDESRKILELDPVMDRKFQQLSKGELQRALMAMSMAYGSSVTFMDEPVFALEEHQKETSLEYLQDYCHRTRRSLVFSAHNIHLCRDYADNTLLMRKDGDFVLGNSKDVCAKDELEAAYQVPMDFLHRKESLYREMLLKQEGSEKK